MPDDGHRELAARPLEGRVEPRPLRGVDPLDDPGVDGDEREAIGLHLEERPALKARRDLVLRAQPLRFGDQSVDAPARGARQAQVGLGAGPHGGARGVGLEKRREERLERVVPVVIARNGVHRLPHALEGQPELRLVVDHRAVRVHDVRRDDDESHVIATGDGQELIAQHVLRRVALAGIADDDEGEVAV